MTYNAQEILSVLNQTMLNGTNDFHEGNNDEFTISLGNRLFDGLFDYAHGATKLAIIPVKKEIDFVIKIPYTGAYNREEGWYSDSPYRYYHQGYDDYYPFENGTYEERPWDYCAIEVQRYAEASLAGFSDCLAETRFLGFVKGYPIYIQEKCEILDSCISKHKHSPEERSYTTSLCKWKGIHCDWLTDFRLYFGEKKLNQFTNFLKYRDWNDLRTENIGYIKDRPVLIDYSSFLE